MEKVALFLVLSDDNNFYYINTSEIPCELLRVDMVIIFTSENNMLFYV